jgi:hypothetical protein
MLRVLRPILVVLSVLTIAVPTADAAVLAQYTFGTPGSETTNESSPAFQPTFVDPTASATAITDPLGTVGLEISSAATTPADAPFLRLDPQGNSVDAAAAITNNKYFEFTLSPLGDVQFDLTSLNFDVARGGAGTPRGYVVRSSLDNFAANLAQADVGTVRPTYTPVAVDLSQFSNVTSSVTFRIYSYSPGAGSSVDYDNIVVNGLVIPEPGSTAALLVGAAMIAGFRRKWRR